MKLRSVKIKSNFMLKALRKLNKRCQFQVLHCEHKLEKMSNFLVGTQKKLYLPSPPGELRGTKFSCLMIFSTYTQREKNRFFSAILILHLCFNCNFVVASK